MSLFSRNLAIILLFFSVFPFSHQQQQQPALDPTEQESLYQVLNSLSPSTPWRTFYPDDHDLCLYPPHGVVCGYFPATSLNQTAHIVELNFGYVSDFTPNPPCSQNATLNPILFTSFRYLRKLFFYNCFNQSTTTTAKAVSFPPSPFLFASTLEELVFIENPSLVAPLSRVVGNFTNLKRLVLIRNGFYGKIPNAIGEFSNLEELSLSGSKLVGEIPDNLGTLKNLKILDLSHNDLEGCVPELLGNGNLAGLLKLDFSHNRFGCEIPGSLGRLKRLVFLDFSYNRFGNFGVPLFLGEVTSLKEVYLSGNLVGGAIPEIWENLGGLVKLGLSEMGLVGKIPASMGVYLRNLSYLGLDNNGLDGPVPEEFGLFGLAGEINLENNSLSGRLPFSTKGGGVWEKMRLGGNRGLCLDNRFLCGENGFNGSLSQMKPLKTTGDGGVVFSGGSFVLVPFDPLMLVMSLGWLFFVFMGF